MISNLSITPVVCPVAARLCVAGKFLRQGDIKVRLRGVSYGPFRPNSLDKPFPEAAQISADLEHITVLGFNTLRLYNSPSEFLLAEAQRLGLKLIVGITWTDHVDCLRSEDQRQAALESVRQTVTALRDHPCVVAFLVGNEIEKTLVRWMGPRRVQLFLEGMIAAGRSCAPDHLFSYATYPSTEYLIPRNADFLAVNVYLEQPQGFSNYLQRLQNLAGNKPLLITEFGLDVATHSEAAQAVVRSWFEQIAERNSVAGTVWFSYTDEWFRSGVAVTDWRFGLVDAERKERLSAQQKLPTSMLTTESWLRFSVIVCTYNGVVTLRACLASLQELRYANYEVLVVDDGSRDDIATIVAEFPSVRYLRQDHAGLSVARNFGAAQATGEILAYTDDDCRAEEDWLAELAAGFDDPRWVACGGPNIPPPPRNATEAVVAAAPGAPAHVLLSDVEAEHLPGCNLAIRKAALEAIGGFCSVYRVAGDDVDICWRLRDAGGHLRFVPGAMVWHHRRYTMAAYIRQQRGYGYAEALLMKEHPQRFGPIGGARWRGAIYGDSSAASSPMDGSIFHGPLGNGMFQGIYQNGAGGSLDRLCGVLWVAICLISLGLHLPAVAMLVFSLSVIAALYRAAPLIAVPHTLSRLGKTQLLMLCWLQPIAREWARLIGMITLRTRPSWHPTLSEVFQPTKPKKWALTIGEWAFWSESGTGREALLDKLSGCLKNAQYEIKLDDGWRRYDVETASPDWFALAFLTVTEFHGKGKCLTRVRCMARVRPLGWLLLAPVVLIRCAFFRYTARRLITEAAGQSGLSALK